MRGKIIWPLLMALLCASVGYAETIDGSKTPERISDEAAFQQLSWIVYLSPTATDNDRGFTAAFAEWYGMTAGELNQLQVLAEQLTEVNNRAEKALSAEEANSIAAEGKDKVSAALSEAKKGSPTLLKILPDVKSGTTMTEGQ